MRLGFQHFARRNPEQLQALTASPVKICWNFLETSLRQCSCGSIVLKSAKHNGPNNGWQVWFIALRKVRKRQPWMPIVPFWFSRWSFVHGVLFGPPNFWSTFRLWFLTLVAVMYLPNLQPMFGILCNFELRNRLNPRFLSMVLFVTSRSVSTICLENLCCKFFSGLELLLRLSVVGPKHLFPSTADLLSVGQQAPAIVALPALLKEIPSAWSPWSEPTSWLTGSSKDVFPMSTFGIMSTTLSWYPPTLIVCKMPFEHFRGFWMPCNCPWILPRPMFGLLRHLGAKHLIKQVSRSNIPVVILVDRCSTPGLLLIKFSPRELLPSNLDGNPSRFLRLCTPRSWMQFGRLLGHIFCMRLVLPLWAQPIMKHFALKLFGPLVNTNQGLHPWFIFH